MGIKTLRTPWISQTFCKINNTWQSKHKLYNHALDIDNCIEKRLWKYSDDKRFGKVFDNILQ